MKTKRLFLLILIISILTGCNNIKSETETLDTTDNKTLTKTEETATEGGTLNLSMRIPKTLNPLTNEDYTVDNILKLIFEPLFTIDENLKPMPNLASNYSISEDGKIITIAIKEGLNWHNGTAITADDVVFSLDVIKQYPNSIYSYVLNKISSYGSKNGYVFIEYIEPYAGAIYNLCFPIIPKNYYQNQLDENSQASFNPVGSGSFKFSYYKLANSLVLEKTTNFKGTPYIDKINILITSDRETELYAFSRNIIDSLTVNFSEWGELNFNREKIDTKIITNSYEFLGFNHNINLYKNVYIRKAIAYAIPKDEIIQNILLETATKSTTPINPNAWNSSYDDIENYEYSLMNATESLAMANVNLSQVQMSLLVNAENPQRIEIAEFIAKRLEQIGISVYVDIKPFDEYLEALENDNFHMFLGGIDFGMVPNFESFLMSTGRGNGGLNYCNFSDARMDYLIQNMYSAIGEERFLQATKEFETYFSEQLPMIGLFFENDILLTDITVMGEKKPNLYSEYRQIEQWHITQ